MRVCSFTIVDPRLFISLPTHDKTARCHKVCHKWCCNFIIILIVEMLLVRGASMAKQLGCCTCNWEALSSSPALTAVSWICFWWCRAQILGHACKIADWFALKQLGFLTLLCSILIICFIIHEKPQRGEDK